MKSSFTSVYWMALRHGSPAARCRCRRRCGLLASDSDEAEDAERPEQVEREHGNQRRVATPSHPNVLAHERAVRFERLCGAAVRQIVRLICRRVVTASRHLPSPAVTPPSPAAPSQLRAKSKLETRPDFLSSPSCFRTFARSSANIGFFAVGFQQNRA